MMGKETDETEASTEVAGRSEFALLARFSIESWTTLLEMVEAIKPPEEVDDARWGNNEFQLRDGWKAVIYYDTGELDYIDSFITPDGIEVDFWEWPDSHPWRDYLINWRGMGDLTRLLEC